MRSSLRSLPHWRLRQRLTRRSVRDLNSACISGREPHNRQRMTDSSAATWIDGYAWYLITAGVLLLVLLLFRYSKRKSQTVDQVVKRIGFEYLSNLVIPSADEGEIHIDHLILSAEGLLVIDEKEVTGTVFGGDKMQEWTVIGSDRRFTFANPQHALLDRIAAVKQIVRQVPVSGKVLFPDGADFTKGTPSMVCKLGDLVAEFGEPDKLAAAAKIEAFKPHWEQIVAQSRSASTVQGRRRAERV